MRTKGRRNARQGPPVARQAAGGLLSGFAGLEAWRTAHAGPFFPTAASLDWFVRNHRTELVASGALILGEGRAGSIVECDKFSQAVVDIKRRESEAKAAP